MAWIFLVLVFGFILLRWLVKALSPQLILVRPIGGQLAKCPDAPNCVSSQAERADQRIKPLVFFDSVKEAKLRLRIIVDNLPGTRVVQDDLVYLCVECESFVFGFLDYMEFLVDERAGVIHVRSISRLPYPDFGVNRRRIDKIRAAFETAR